MGELTESSFLEKLSEVGDLDWIQNALGGKATIGLMCSLLARAKTTSKNKSIEGNEQRQQEQGGEKEEKHIQDEAKPILASPLFITMNPSPFPPLLPEGSGSWPLYLAS